LTFEREVRYIWKGKLTFANALFYCFRYLALLNVIFVGLGYVPWLSWRSSYSCVVIVGFEMAGDVLILMSAAVFTAMRVYAMFHRLKWIFLMILALGMINPVVSIVGLRSLLWILNRLRSGSRSCI